MRWADALPWVEPFAAVVTAFIALLVFLVTRSIARAEATREINGMWQSFNQTMLEDDNAQRYRQFFEGGRGDLSKDYRLQYLVFMLLNNLHAEFVHGRRKFIGRRHFASTMSAHYQFMGPRKDALVALMRDNGYDPIFIEFIEQYVQPARV